MQDHTADQLHIKVPHLQHPATGLAYHGKGLGQNLEQDSLLLRHAFFGVVDTFQPGRDPGPELQRLGAELFVRQSFHRRLERPGLFDLRRQPLDHAFVTGSENLG